MRNGVKRKERNSKHDHASNPKILTILSLHFDPKQYNQRVAAKLKRGMDKKIKRIIISNIFPIFLIYIKYLTVSNLTE